MTMNAEWETLPWIILRLICRYVDDFRFFNVLRLVCSSYREQLPIHHEILALLEKGKSTTESIFEYCNYGISDGALTWMIDIMGSPQEDTLVLCGNGEHFDRLLRFSEHWDLLKCNGLCYADLLRACESCKMMSYYSWNLCFVNAIRTENMKYVKLLCDIFKNEGDACSVEERYWYSESEYKEFYKNKKTLYKEFHKHANFILKCLEFLPQEITAELISTSCENLKGRPKFTDDYLCFWGKMIRNETLSEGGNIFIYDHYAACEDTSKRLDFLDSLNRLTYHAIMAKMVMSLNDRERFLNYFEGFIDFMCMERTETIFTLLLNCTDHADIEFVKSVFVDTSFNIEKILEDGMTDLFIHALRYDVEDKLRNILSYFSVPINVDMKEISYYFQPWMIELLDEMQICTREQLIFYVCGCFSSSDIVLCMDRFIDAVKKINCTRKELLRILTKNLWHREIYVGRMSRFQDEFPELDDDFFDMYRRSFIIYFFTFGGNSIAVDILDYIYIRYGMMKKQYIECILENTVIVEANVLSHHTDMGEWALQRIGYPLRAICRDEEVEAHTWHTIVYKLGFYDVVSIS